jgi:hypothetical protein
MVYYRAMAEQHGNMFTVCMNGPKCSLKYRLDFEARLRERGADDQGTGNLCQDLEEKAKRMGVEIETVPSLCLDLCPMPWERSNFIGPDGKLHRVYFDDLDATLASLLK